MGSSAQKRCGRASTWMSRRVFPLYAALAFPVGGTLRAGRARNVRARQRQPLGAGNARARDIPPRFALEALLHKHEVQPLAEFLTDLRHARCFRKAVLRMQP